MSAAARSTPDEDNMLKISGDGRKAALDLRLVGEQPDPDGGKIAVAADRIAAIYHVDRRASPTATTPASRTLGPAACSSCSATSTPARRRVGTSTTSCGPCSTAAACRPRPSASSTTPAPTRPRPSCSPPAATAGSRCSSARPRRWASAPTSRPGPIALHHLDCPWRPADIEQREGRILRQGNQNPEVPIVRYVTEGTFDIFMWQTVERKAAFIHQVATGRRRRPRGRRHRRPGPLLRRGQGARHRQPADPGEGAVDAEVARLARLRRAHHDDQHRLRRALRPPSSERGPPDAVSANSNPPSSAGRTLAATTSP